MRYFPFVSLLALSSLSLGSIRAADELTLYTQRHYAFDEELHAMFTAKTGIKVNVVKANADELMVRIQEEGANSPADIFMTADGGTLDRARVAGLLTPIASPDILNRVAGPLRDPEGHWIAMTQRGRVLVYTPDRVKPGELSTYEDLADPKWRGRLLVRSSTSAYNQSLLATIIAGNDSQKAADWAKAVRENMARPPQGSDRDQARAIAAGLGDVAIMNTYYVGLMETSEDQADREAVAKLRVFFPNQDGRGAHVNISGLGILKASKKIDLAAKFIEFILSDEAQSLIPGKTFEYPVVTTVAWSEQQERWGKFKADPVSLSTLGELNAEAVRIFNEAGWE